MHMIGDAKLFLATLTLAEPVDVIAIQSPVSEVAFKDYCDRHRISYMETNERDAALILRENNGVGMGCYTTDGDQHSDFVTMKRIEAMRLKGRLATIVGFLDTKDPVQVSALEAE